MASTPVVRVPERRKRAGVCYALTDDGIELPVVDVTHPAFALELSEAQLQTLVDELSAQHAQRAKLPTWLQKLFLSAFLRKSTLARGLQAASGSFLSGMSTYLFKLGADNLGDYAAPIDHTIAKALPAMEIRLRLQDMAELLAEALLPALKESAKPDAAKPELEPVRELHLLNIASGPAMDSLNALLLLRARHASELGDRTTFIHCLDLHGQAPAFGERALRALQSDNAALHGVKAQLSWVAYDWNDTAALEQTLQLIAARPAVLACSSEGGLFAYASDEAMVANLRVLYMHTPPDTCFVGTVTRADGAGQLLRSVSDIKVHARELPDFQALIERAGWHIETVRSRPLDFVVRLAKQ